MNDWSQTEVDLIIADYFSMLSDELSGIPINKSFHRQALLPLLNNRNGASVEYKHRNITAVLIALEKPFLKGYKPMWNYQKLLAERIRNYLDQHQVELEPKFETFTETTILSPDYTQQIFDKTLQQAPEISKDAKKVKEEITAYGKRASKINYLEREQQNATLGRMGEEFVLAYEKWRLIQAGKESWADKVEWIADDDDAAGFDILSKNDNGTDRYIEVKTTKLSKETPLFFSQNEYIFSKENSSQYHLYRVFNFAQSPKLFIANGSFDDFCLKEPVTYRGNF
jgi:hypothetical protein